MLILIRAGETTLADATRRVVEATFRASKGDRKAAARALGAPLASLRKYKTPRPPAPAVETYTGRWGHGRYAVSHTLHLDTSEDA